MARLPLMLVVVVVLAAPAAADAYGWPLKPFDRPHPIRGAFDDPRFHLDAEGQLAAFHFGVDIAAPDGTAVYAVAPGRVHRNHSVVYVRQSSGREFSYWHIRPVVRMWQRVRTHQLLGYILPGWGHVHLAEDVNGHFRNPLRRRALTPFFDNTKPTVESIEVVGLDGTPVDPAHLTGTVGIVASVYDTPPLKPPPPWDVARLAPAYIWWRLVGQQAPAPSWHLSVDFSVDLLPALMYEWIYAPGTYQNKPHRPGRYLFWLEHALDASGYPDGVYQLEVLAEDTRGNLGSGALAVTIANGADGG